MALDSTDLEPLVERLLSELSVEAPEPAQLGSLLRLVITWNRKIDLTAARSADELVDLMFADAAVLAQQSEATGRWVDVGSGCGAPGLSLALLAPELEMTLVEPRAKRVAFLRTAVATLGCERVRVVRARSENLDDDGFEVAVARATLPPPAWLAEGARLAGAVWVLLARDDAPSLEGWVTDRVIRYRWPLTGVERRALRYVRG